MDSAGRSRRIGCALDKEDGQERDLDNERSRLDTIGNLGRRGRVLSSTPLEVLLFLNGWYYATYFVMEILMFAYKGLLLPYPTANLTLDLVMLFLYLAIEVIRIFFAMTSSAFVLICNHYWKVGSKGNLTQRKLPVVISVGLTFPAAMMALYYLLLQTYVLRLEAVMNVILLIFYALEVLLDIVALVSFSRLETY